MNLLTRAIVAVALPAMVFVGGASLMSRWTGRQAVRDRLNRDFPDDPRPLNVRVGYDVATVRAQWASLDPAMRDTERRFLELDLVFPLLYGAALAVGLLLMWAAADRPVNAAWLIALVGITILADWTENLTQLHELRQFNLNQRLDAGWIGIASVATMAKLTFFTAASSTIVILTAVAVYRSFAGKS